MRTMKTDQFEIECHMGSLFGSLTVPSLNPPSLVAASNRWLNISSAIDEWFLRRLPVHLLDQRAWSYSCRRGRAMRWLEHGGAELCELVMRPLYRAVTAHDLLELSTFWFQPGQFSIDIGACADSTAQCQEIMAIVFDAFDETLGVIAGA